MTGAATSCLWMREEGNGPTGRMRGGSSYDDMEEREMFLNQQDLRWFTRPDDPSGRWPTWGIEKVWTVCTGVRARTGILMDSHSILAAAGFIVLVSCQVKFL